MMVYYLMAQRPDELVQHARIFHDLYTPWIQPSIGEPCGPSDCMWLVPETEPSSKNWLQQYVSDAVSRPLCTKIGCTTCGAYKFRWGLMARISGSKQSRAELLLELMRELKPEEHARFAWEKAMRLMIFDRWSDLGGDGALRLMQDRLGESWAGHVLGKMIACEEARRRARQEHKACSVMAQEQRVQRKQERQLRHERRLLQKKERDKLWWANAASRIRSDA
jgi:hypothetical protein